MTFSSVYEILDAISTTRKQRFWDWFDGDALKSIWTTTDLSGTNTFGMDDNIDGGFKITTATTNGNRGQIEFNDVRSFTHNASVLIGVMKRATGSMLINMGMFNNTEIFANSFYNGGLVSNDSSDTNYELGTSTAAALSNTASSIAIDTNWRVHKLEFGASDVKLTIDGTLEVTKTTNLPTTKMQPAFGARSRGGAGDGHIRYMEVYNT